LSFEVVVFDCDGTLVDSEALITAAMVEAFAGAGQPAPAASAVRRVIGLSLDEAVRGLVPQAPPALRARLAER